jgi:hypothetical protein
MADLAGAHVIVAPTEDGSVRLNVSSAFAAVKVTGRVAVVRQLLGVVEPGLDVLLRHCIRLLLPRTPLPTVRHSQPPFGAPLRLPEEAILQAKVGAERRSRR